MRLSILDYACVGGRRGNEDAAGWERSALWVVDGATALDDTATWRQTSGRWAATETHLLLGGLLGQRPEMGLTDLVYALVDGLSTSWAERTAPLADLSHLLPPVCSVALARLFDNPPRVELSTIGDCVAVCYNPSTGAVVTVAESGFGAKDSTAARLPSDEKLAALRSDRRRYIEGADGLWVLSTNPQVAEAVDPVVVSDPGGSRILVATDGYARALGSVPDVDTWADLVVGVDRRGLHAVLADLRTAEAAAGSEGRLKGSDDAAAVLAAIR